jgi:hypothetical protein
LFLVNGEKRFAHRQASIRSLAGGKTGLEQRDLALVYLTSGTGVQHWERRCALMASSAKFRLLGGRFDDLETCHGFSWQLNSGNFEQ